MSNTIPKRSVAGCLTCKRRKKKCDERRPYCRRCELGDFCCLGYNTPGTGPAGDLSDTAIFWPSHIPTAHLEGTPSLEVLDSFVALLGYKNEADNFIIPCREATALPTSVPREVVFDPTLLEDTASLVVCQYVKFSREMLFKAPLISIEEGVRRRFSDSSITRWSMYLGARIITDLLGGINTQKYVGWIFRFCQEIIETPSSNELESSLKGRLNGLYDLIGLGSVISGTATSYLLFQRCTPIFLRLAALHPKIWVNDSCISVPETFRSFHYEITQFVVHDTVAALVLGIPSQLQYDSRTFWVDKGPGHYMEWIYGFPVGVLILISEITSWRASRMMSEMTRGQSHYQDIESRLDSWNPIVDHTDEPNNNIARLAVQEAWCQAALVYLYMGMSEVNSADPRVERAVQQVVQLGSAIAKDSALERHLLVPSLIAGVAARREKHRAALRNKIFNEMSPKVNALTSPVRGGDFVGVLDHLWHGPGSGGNPVTWDDYVQSRCTVLPLPHEYKE